MFIMFIISDGRQLLLLMSSIICAHYYTMKRLPEIKNVLNVG